MADEKIRIIVCLVCEKRGPNHICFHADLDHEKSARTNQPHLKDIRIECECGNRETIFDSVACDDLNQRANRGEQLDLSNLKRFAYGDIGD